MVKLPLEVYAYISRFGGILELKGMLMIDHASSGEKVCLIISPCQVPWCGLNKLLTVIPAGKATGGLMSLKVSELGS